MKHKNSSASGGRIHLGDCAEHRSRTLPVLSESGSFTLIQAGRRFMLGLQGVVMAIRYKVFFLRSGFQAFFSKTSVRLGIIGLVLFLFFGEELRVVLHLPWRGGTALGRMETMPVSGERDAMSLAQPALSAASVQSEAVFTTVSVEDLDPVQVQRYIDRFSQVSRLEMKRFGIPASLLMAQGISESRAGSKESALKHNNHFEQQLRGQKFKTAWDSWRTHSLFMVKRYPSLLEYGEDVDAWAKALRRAGYSHEWNYARRLLRIIDAYQLRELDRH